MFKIPLTHKRTSLILHSPKRKFLSINDLALSLEYRRAAIHKLLELKKSGLPILNSADRLKAMLDNKCPCHEDILINVDPDGTITESCYVKNRGEINCDACGFTPVAEASGAIDFIPQSLYA